MVAVTYSPTCLPSNRTSSIPFLFDKDWFTIHLLWCQIRQSNVTGSMGEGFLDLFKSTRKGKPNVMLVSILATLLQPGGDGAGWGGGVYVWQKPHPLKSQKQNYREKEPALTPGAAATQLLLYWRMYVLIVYGNLFQVLLFPFIQMQPTDTVASENVSYWYFTAHSFFDLLKWYFSTTTVTQITNYLVLILVMIYTQKRA